MSEGGFVDAANEMVAGVRTAAKQHTFQAAGGKSFEIQPDQLPKVLAGLDEVRAKFAEAREGAAELANTAPPFTDDVTMNVAKRIAEQAGGADGSLVKTTEGMIKWVENFRDTVKKAIEDHQRIDDENRMA